MLYKIYKNIFLKNWLAWISILVGVGLLVYLFLIFNPAQITESLRKITLWQFVLIAIMRLFFSAVGTLRWKIILNYYKQKISFWKLYWFKYAIFTVVYFIPPAGAFGEQAFGAVLLKNEKVPFKVGLVSVFLDTIITGIISALITLFVLGFLLFNFVYNLNYISSLAFSFLLTAFLSVLFFWLLKRLVGIGTFLEKLKLSRKFISDIKNFAKLFYSFLNYNKKTFFQVILLTLFSYILVLIELLMIVYFLGKIFTPLQLAIVESGNVIASIVPISQALGVAELFSAYTVSLVGYTAAFGVALSLILRARHLFSAFIGIAVLIFYGLIKLRKR